MYDAVGYVGVAIAVALETIVAPIPSEVILPLSGFYVGSGDLAYGWVVLAATVGSLAGALVIYALARVGGRALLLRHGRWQRIRESDLDRADDWFDRHGGWAVLVGRLVPGARSLVSIPAGLSEMPLVRFVVLTAVGSALWNAALVGAGWALGRSYEKVGDLLGPIGTGITAVIVLTVVVVWWRRRRR
jgi:membrane protein DedA with SNARE-associated domain